jgi:hypothetical protein
LVSGSRNASELTLMFQNRNLSGVFLFVQFYEGNLIASFVENQPASNFGVNSVEARFHSVAFINTSTRDKFDVIASKGVPLHPTIESFCLVVDVSRARPPC